MIKCLGGCARVAVSILPPAVDSFGYLPACRTLLQEQSLLSVVASCLLAFSHIVFLRRSECLSKNFLKERLFTAHFKWTQRAHRSSITILRLHAFVRHWSHWRLNGAFQQHFTNKARAQRRRANRRKSSAFCGLPLSRLTRKNWLEQARHLQTKISSELRFCPTQNAVGLQLIM